MYWRKLETLKGDHIQVQKPPTKIRNKDKIDRIEESVLIAMAHTYSGIYRTYDFVQ